MRVREALAAKADPRRVATVTPEASVTEMLGELARHGIGALVVLNAAGDLCGIVSERDVVRRLNERGPSVLSAPVAEIMTGAVVTCGPDDEVPDVLRLMTDRRLRHVPVLDDGRMIGLVSIGDLVKARVNDLENAADSLERYITGGGR
jgi:CBS domain-containing protein